jgi:predicted phosphodiesterase
MSHRDTIFEEDVRQFEGQRADILVCHEAPTPHRYGFAAIAKLAAELRGRLVVHGHHHRSEEYRTEAGIRVHSLGLAEVWAMPGDYMQEGGEV